MKEENDKVLGVLRGLIKNIEDGKITLTTGHIMQNDDGTEEYNICGIRKQPQKPTIIKSGDTWVSESRGVNYLCINPGKEQPKFKMNHPAFYLYWENMDNIEITDEIAKLRPMMISKYKRIVIAYGVNNIRKDHTLIASDVDDNKVGDFNIDAFRLATVKDLQE